MQIPFHLLNGNDIGALETPSRHGPTAKRYAGIFLMVMVLDIRSPQPISKWYAILLQKSRPMSKWYFAIFLMVMVFS